MDKKAISSIKEQRDIGFEAFGELMSTDNKELLECLRDTARDVADDVYGKKVYIRGLIEISNYCRNDCLYCGIRRSNCNADRYRLSREQILGCCNAGYELGFRTFVMQGGEDTKFKDDLICDIIDAVKKKHPDCAITLSLGEKSGDSYKRFFDAGADRYLLRHETADKLHYEKLHPNDMSFDNRMRCLYDLKEIGYQVGCGFMVGSPYQTVEHLYKDIQFIKDFKPHMVGIGPFISHKDTPFSDKASGTMDATLRLLSIIRLIHPNVLLPATTALGTIHPKGREMGILAGANVVMPNLSPVNVREKYSLYDNKICTGEEAAECQNCLRNRMNSIGYEIVEDRGDYKS